MGYFLFYCSTICKAKLTLVDEPLRTCKSHATLYLGNISKTLLILNASIKSYSSSQ
uniref:Uncharacterized protein n=1 Tax=Arundo donax TaxID=35708 RepID=A0A0A8Z9Y1_ARUDO